jgi:nucleotide-binding universal stress UspA family protein
LQKQVELWLVCAMEPVISELNIPNIDELIIERTRTGKSFLRRARELIGDSIPIHEEILFGSPAECILDVASSHACDLIIMGTRGQGGLRELLLGSQIHKVISLAECPVLAVK